MRLTEKEVLEIVEKYKEQFPRIKDTLTKIQFSLNYDVLGKEDVSLKIISRGESRFLFFLYICP